MSLANSGKQAATMKVESHDKQASPAKKVSSGSLKFLETIERVRKQRLLNQTPYGLFNSPTSKQQKLETQTPNREKISKLASSPFTPFGVRFADEAADERASSNKYTRPVETVAPLVNERGNYSFYFQPPLSYDNYFGRSFDKDAGPLQSLSIGVFQIDIKGCQYHSCAETLNYSTLLEFKREPTNEYDGNAIQIIHPKTKEPIGYIAKKLAHFIAPLVDSSTLILLSARCPVKVSESSLHTFSTLPLWIQLQINTRGDPERVRDSLLKAIKYTDWTLMKPIKFDDRKQVIEELDRLDYVFNSDRFRIRA